GLPVLVAFCPTSRSRQRQLFSVEHSDPPHRFHASEPLLGYEPSGAPLQAPGSFSTRRSSSTDRDGPPTFLWCFQIHSLPRWI
ncbi:hypothetical protein GOODEAATRI_034515, partial [Goodea atripinnis]